MSKRNTSIAKIGFLIGKDGEDSIHKKQVKNFKEVPDHHRWEGNNIDVDVAIAYYIKQHYCVDIDIIEPNDVTKKRLLKNDLNFCIGFDVITADWLADFFPDLKKRVEPIFKQSKKYKVYPSWKLQNFVYRKGPYLKQFEKAGIPIAPTILMRSTGTFNMARVNRVLKKLEKTGWTSFVIKPEMGAGSFGFKMMSVADVVKNPDKLLKYFRQHYKNFPGFILQQAMDGFTKYWEYRLWWYNGKFAYGIANKAAVVAGGTEIISKNPPKKELEICKKIGKRIFALLPKIKYHGTVSQPVMIRTDFGCCIGNTLDKSKYFLNEFELQAANYFTSHTPYPVIEKGAIAYVKKFELVTGKKLRELK
jgi:hypothetical protein